MYYNRNWKNMEVMLKHLLFP